MGGPTFTGSSMSMLGDVDDEDGMYGGGPVEASASDRVVGKYILRDTLGKGVEGKVKLGVDMETGEEVALKIVDLTEARRRSRQWKSVQKEIAIMTRAKHENVRGGRRKESVGARSGARERESEVEGGGRDPYEILVSSQGTVGRLLSVVGIASRERRNARWGSLGVGCVCTRVTSTVPFASLHPRRLTP